MDPCIGHQELQVVPSGLLCRGRSKQVCRVIRYQDFASAIVMQPASHAAHRQGRAQQRSHADGSQANDVLRPNDIELFFKVLAAIRDLVWLWIPVARRSTLDGVEDVDLFAAKRAGLDHLGQQLPGFAHKRAARLILI